MKLCWEATGSGVMCEESPYTYLISQQEKKKVREFVKEQLRKGYIRPSKLLQTSLVFLIGKKDGKKRIV